MKPGLALPLLALLAACGSGMTPEEKARRDARDIQFVKNAQKQHAPAQPIALDAIPPDVQALIPPAGSGCRFVLKEKPDGDPVALFGTVTGHIRVAGHVLALAPDTGSSKVPGGAWAKYVGKTHVVKLTANPGGGAWVEVLDPYDRQVYLTPGELRCGEAPASGASTQH